MSDGLIRIVSGLQVWRGKCAVTGRRIGGHAPLVIVRWEPSLPPEPYNIVLLVQEAAKKIEVEGLASVDDITRSRIEGRLNWARSICT